MLQKKDFKVFFPSTYTKNENSIVCASRPEIDENLRFCSTRVIHDGYELKRQQKVENICKFIRKDNLKFNIRVCYRSLIGDNYCKCEKCYRTIMALIAEKVDPRKHGFTVNKKVISEIKMMLENGDISNNVVVSSMWSDIGKKFFKEKKYWSKMKEMSWVIDFFDDTRK